MEACRKGLCCGLPGLEVEGEAPLEPGEAGHHLGAGGCGGEGELAEQHEQPPGHTTRTGLQSTTWLLYFRSGLGLLQGGLIGII